MDEITVRQKARSFISSCRSPHDRYDLSHYLERCNAKLNVEELGPGEAGSTLTLPNGRHVIAVNARESERRQRFTICHEIAHIILELPSSHAEVPPWSLAKRDSAEIACDWFASELLMPYTLWYAQVPQEEPSVKLIEYIAEIFGASYHAAASRYATLAPIPCALVTMSKGIIRHTARSTMLRQQGAWITPRSPIPAQSVAARLRANGERLPATDEVQQDIWFENWTSNLYLWELSRHYPKADTTTALLWIEEEELPETEPDRFGRQIEDDNGLPELTGELPWPGRRRRR